MVRPGPFDRAAFDRQQLGIATLYDLDLLVAAWQWPVALTEKVSGYSAEALREMRHHHRAVSGNLIGTVREMRALHYWLWLKGGPAPFAEWWRCATQFQEPIGERIPLDVVKEEGRRALRPLTAYLESWIMM